MATQTQLHNHSDDLTKSDNNLVTYELCDFLLSDDDTQKNPVIKCVYLYDSDEVPYNYKFDQSTNTYIFNSKNADNFNSENADNFDKNTILFPVPVQYINSIRNCKNLMDIFNTHVTNFTSSNGMWHLNECKKYTNMSILVERKNCIMPTMGIYLEFKLSKLSFITLK
jgi:hypothetical protein